MLPTDPVPRFQRTLSLSVGLEVIAWLGCEGTIAAVLCSARFSAFFLIVDITPGTPCKVLQRVDGVSAAMMANPCLPVLLQNLVLFNCLGMPQVLGIADGGPACIDSHFKVLGSPAASCNTPFAPKTTFWRQQHPRGDENIFLVHRYVCVPSIGSNSYVSQLTTTYSITTLPQCLLHNIGITRIFEGPQQTLCLKLECSRHHYFLVLVRTRDLAVVWVVACVLYSIANQYH